MPEYTIKQKTKINILDTVFFIANKWPELGFMVYWLLTITELTLYFEVACFSLIVLMDYWHSGAD